MSSCTTEQILKAGAPAHLFTSNVRNRRRSRSKSSTRSPSRTKSSTKSPARSKSSTKSPSRSGRTLDEDASDDASPPKKLSLARRASAAAANLGKAAMSPTGMKVGAAAAVIGGGLLAKKFMKASVAGDMWTKLTSNDGMEYRLLNERFKKEIAGDDTPAPLDNEKYRVRDHNIQRYTPSFLWGKWNNVKKLELSYEKELQDAAAKNSATSKLAAGTQLVRGLSESIISRGAGAASTASGAAADAAADDAR